MSVKSASERNSQDEAVRRTRETYQQRETESAKKHGKQVKQLTESSQAEIERIREDHANQMEELKTKTREAITARDMHYQKEIGEMREMHQKQLQRMASEAEGREGRSEGALKTEIERVKTTSAQQRDALSKTQEQELMKRDRAMEEYAVATRKAQQTSQTDTKKKMSQAHAKELNALVKDRDDRLEHERREKAELRRTSGEQIKTLEQNKKLEAERLISDHSVSVRNVQSNAHMNAEAQREAQQQGIQQNRQRYENALEDIRQNSLDARGSLEKTVNGRLTDRIRQLETENKTLKNDVPRAEVRANHKKERELTNLRDNLTANINQLERSRQDTVEAANEKTAQEIKKMNDNRDDLVNRTNRFHQDKAALDGARANERYNKTKTDYEKKLGHEQTMNDARLDKLQGFNEMEQGKMRSYFERASASMKENFETTLRDMRETNKRDQDQIFAQFSKQSQENDMKFQQKLGEVTVRYERQLAEMQDKHLKEKQEQQALAERSRKETERKGSQDVKSMSSQYEHRIGKMEEAHRREIDQLQRKHEETLANLTKNRQA